MAQAQGTKPKFKINDLVWIAQYSYDPNSKKKITVKKGLKAKIVTDYVYVDNFYLVKTEDGNILKAGTSELTLRKASFNIRKALKLYAKQLHDKDKLNAVLQAQKIIRAFERRDAE